MGAGYATVVVAEEKGPEQPEGGGVEDGHGELCRMRNNEIDDGGTYACDPSSRDESCQRERDAGIRELMDDARSIVLQKEL